MELANTQLTVMKPKKEPFWGYFKKNYTLYLMIIPGMVLLILFKYLPMYGVLVSFMNYMPNKGIFGSKWVGFAHYIRFFKDPYFFRLMRNTFTLGILTIVINFPAPIIMALLINEIKNGKFKRTVQTISYMPHFLSSVIVIGIMLDMFRLTEGVVNDLIQFLGAARINFFDRSEWFRFLYIVSQLWQNVGFGSIIYLAAITNINPEIYESAILDGANRLQQAIYITIPSILPTIVTLFILRIGGMLGNDYQRILLMYNAATYETADVVQTYLFRQGIEGGSFSYATAVGIFLSISSFIFLIITNKISKKVGDVYLW